MHRYSIILVLLISVSGLSACGGIGAYRNARFTVGSEWTSDREHLYAILGSPDSIETGPPSEPRPPEEGGGYADALPYEIWHYSHLKGIADDMDLEFVDECLCGDYQLNRPNVFVTALVAQ
jgi:hypothetical protein